MNAKEEAAPAAEGPADAPGAPKGDADGDDAAADSLLDQKESEPEPDPEKRRKSKPAAPLSPKASGGEALDPLKNAVDETDAGSAEDTPGVRAKAIPDL